MQSQKSTKYIKTDDECTAIWATPKPAPSC